MQITYWLAASYSGVLSARLTALRAALMKLPMDTISLCTVLYMYVQHLGRGQLGSRNA